MDEIEQESVETVGDRLRLAREAKGMTLDELAATTRIPTRHLRSLETGDWSALPAPTYTMGFAKNYAVAVGLDRDEIGDALRAEMGGTRPYVQQPIDPFEPSDPKRVMPKGLVIGALIALVVVALGLTWLNNRSLSDDGPAASVDNGLATVPADATIAPPEAAKPVVITANAPAWIEVRDGGTILKQGELALGQSFEVPATAVAPVLTTAKPEALRISVGTADAPTVGPAGVRVSGVSLKGDDLLKGPAAAAPQPTPAATAAPARPTAKRPATRAPTASPAPAEPKTTPATATPPVTGNTAG